MKLHLALALWAALAAGMAHAALFEDDEARKQIAELGTRIEERLTQLETAGRNRALDLTQLLDALKQDIAQLRGQIEVLANRADTAERRQKELYTDLDNRLRKIEQTQEKISQTEREAAAEKQTYEAALNQFKLGNYQLAIAGFQGFMNAFSSSALVPSAQYWIGNAHYAMRDYKAAIAAQQKLLSSWPDNPKAADAMLNIASSQSEMGDSKGARDTLSALLKKYPTSPAAEQAKQRLGRR